MRILTANEHDDDGEDLLHVGVGRDVSESNAGEAGEGEVEGGDVLGLDGGASLAVIAVELVRHVSQGVEPADLGFLQGALGVRNRVPNAREPVRDQRESCHQEEQHCGPVLRVAVDFAGHANQPKEAGRFQETDQRRRLQGDKNHK